MKKTLLALTAVITTAATSISLCVASVSNPTEMQKQLGDRAITVASAGAIAIFGMLDDDKDHQDQDDEDS